VSFCSIKQFSEEVRKMTNPRTLIRNGTVLTLAEPGEHFGKGRLSDVLIEDGKIREVAPGIKADGCELIDATACIVMPGLVDTHRHVWQTALRGICADDTLKGYMRAIRFLRAKLYRPEDIYAGNWVGMLEAINAGITTVFDFSHCINSPQHAAAAIQGLRDSGARALFGYGYNEVPLEQPAFRSLQDRLTDMRRLRKEVLPNDDAFVTMAVATSDLPICGIERLKTEMLGARDLGLRISIHANTWEFPERTPEIGLLKQHSLLGPDLLFVHTNLSNDDEIKMIAHSGGWIASTPETEMQMCMGPSVIGRFMRAGGLPTFGTDIISNNSGDLLVQARLGLQTQRLLDNAEVLRTHEGPEMLTLSAREALRAVTINGAKALGLERKTGTLEPGKDADLILVRTDEINTMPLNDPVATLLLHSHPGNVDTVMVAGTVLKRGGKLVANMDKAKKVLGDSHQYLVDRVAKTKVTLPGGYKAD
jgi:5-methylthioadenosine/S-adenosylhomocysteine deaminase